MIDVCVYVASNFKCFKCKGPSLPFNPKKNGRNECNLVKTMYECIKRNSLVKKNPIRTILEARVTYKLVCSFLKIPHIINYNPIPLTHI